MSEIKKFNRFLAEGGQDLVRCRGKIIRETPKAYLMQTRGGIQFWIPSSKKISKKVSIVTDNGDDLYSSTIIVPRWWFDENIADKLGTNKGKSGPDKYKQPTVQKTNAIMDYEKRTGNKWEYKYGIVTGQKN